MSSNNTSSGDPDHRLAPSAPPRSTDYRHARWPTFGDAFPRSRPRPPLRSDHPDIVVVGVCSAGKSTLVSNLKQAGFRAQAVAQEHSGVPHLWELSKAGMLVYLDASLNTIRKRRRANWPQNMLDEEHRRLAHAREHCDVYLPTDAMTPTEVASKVIEALNGSPGGQPRPDGSQTVE